MESNNLNEEEQLKAENEVLKLKLEMEHGMSHSDTSSLDPRVENSWLNYVFDFEQQYKNVKQKKIYDILGRPAYRKIESLTKEEIPQALDEIILIMREKGIEFDCTCDYEYEVIYRFITEELFEYEMDDVSIEGMVTCFNYEEFHPNHEYDLKRYTNEFVESLIQEKWNPEFDVTTLSKTTYFNDKPFNNDEVSKIILAFQEGRTFVLDNLSIESINFDLEKGVATVQGKIGYQAMSQQEKKFFQGDLNLGFKYDYGYWYISSFQLPGLG